MASLVASVTRATVPGGPLADLDLNAPGAYEAVGFGPGQTTWRRSMASSRWVHGEVLTHATKGLGSMPLRVRVLGASAAALDTNTAALIAAFEQWTYDFTAVVDGVTHTWRCMPADYGPTPDEGGSAGEYGTASLDVLAQLYTFIIPRNPVPLAGAI